MRHLTRAFAVLALLQGFGAGRARAEPLDDRVVPPTLASDPAVAYPRAAIQAGFRQRIEVTLILDLDAGGTVERASVGLPQPHPAFFEAALEASKRLRFEPARRAGRAVAARIKFLIVFEPPPEPPPAAAAATPIAPAAPPPTPLVTSTPAAPSEPLEVTVHGNALPPAVSTYTRAEVRQIPGAFGDPFRAVETLPGVTPVASGIPYFFVRGAPPGNVGYFFDGIRVPYLYHVGFGPSVIQPAFVERVDLYPGGYPARIGRFAGGVVDATATEPRPTLRGEANLRLFDAGAFMEAGFADGRGTAALGGRYSYTGALLTLLVPEVRLDYRDAQARVTYDVTPRDRIGITSFGSYDLLADRATSRASPDGEVETIQFGTEFYRADMRYEHFFDAGKFLGAVTLGFDRTNVGFVAGEPRNVVDRSIAVRTQVEARAAPGVVLRGGADVALDAYHVESSRYGDPDDPERQQFERVFSSRDDIVVGGWADAVLDVTPSIEVTPGVRVDAFRSGSATSVGVDPRVAARFAVGKRVRIVHAYGLVHQPPSFVLPLSALSPVTTGTPLQKSLQASAGTEVDFGDGMLATGTLFYNAFFDTSDALTALPENGPPDYESRAQGSAFGAEVLLKRQLTKRLGGFISYTLSRSVRSIGGKTFVSGFDRTHVANAALGYEIGRGWRPGARFVFYTGTPVSSESGGTDDTSKSTKREPPFHRLDVRVEKRWKLGGSAWISLVLEVMNATLRKERFGGEAIGPITIPSIGAEGGF
jgi:TonB family protein